MQRIHLACDGQRVRKTAAYPVTAVRLCFFSNQLDDCHLHQFVHTRDGLEVVQEIPHGRGLGYAGERDKCIAFAGRVGFLETQLELH